MRELLARLGERRTLVLAIDDLQWGDSDSAVLLSELLRPPEGPRLLLLGCYRSDDAATSPLLRALLNVHEAAGPGVDRRVLALGTLEPTDALDLALSLLDRRDEAGSAHAAAIARESGGNPFFVAELVRYVQADTGLLHRGSGVDLVVFDEMLWAHVRLAGGRAAPAGGRRRVGPAARAGGRVTGRPSGAGEQKALHLLRSGRLIRSTGPLERDEIETYHDRVREAVVAHVAPIALEGHHRNLAQVLESSGRADPEVLAIHFHWSAATRAQGMYYGQAAAQAAEALAFDRAAEAVPPSPGTATGGRRTCAGSEWGSRMHWRTPGAAPRRRGNTSPRPPEPRSPRPSSSGGAPPCSSWSRATSTKDTHSSVRS